MWTFIPYINAWAHPLTTPNGIRVQSAVLLQYTLRTDRQADWPSDRWSRRMFRNMSDFRSLDRSDAANNHIPWILWFQFGVVGQYVLAALTATQLLLFSIIAFEFRTKAPGAKTFLQVKHLSQCCVNFIIIIHHLCRQSETIVNDEWQWCHDNKAVITLY